MTHRKNNPYMQMVEDHEKIINIDEEIYINKWKWNKYFWNDNNIFLEIWTWMWNYFSDESSSNLNINYIWMEIKFKRLYNTVEKSKTKWAIDNYVAIQDYWQKIDKIFSAWEISEVIVYFPDPWGKKDRQKKHRLFSEEFVSNLYIILKDWWKIIFKTDHREYFETTLNFFKEDKWESKVLSFDYEKELWNFDKNKMTEFEHIFRKDKCKINYVEFIKK